MNVGPNDGVPTPPTVAKANAKAPPGMTATAINSPKTGEKNTGQDEYRKYGHSSDGSDNWDVWEDSDRWWERHRPLNGPSGDAQPAIDEHQTPTKGSEKKKKKM